MAAIFTNRPEDQGQVVLFRPVDTGEGTFTEVFTIQGKVLVSTLQPRPAYSVRQAIARSRGIDLTAQAEQIKRKFHRYPPLPFYLPPSGSGQELQVFIPLKMRRPLVAGDSPYGYVDLDYVDDIFPADGGAALYLQGGGEFPLYSSISTAREVLYLGGQVKRHFNRGEDREKTILLQAVKILLDRLGWE